MKVFATALALSLGLVATAAIAQDASFYDKAAQGGMAEVASGKLAASKASKQEVRDFGSMMVKDHSAANDKLAAIAKSKGITLPSAPDAAHKASMKALESQQGAAFDRAYLADQVKAHEETVQLLKGEIASGRDADAKAWAQQTLPTVESHLREVYRLSGQPDKAASAP